MKQTRRKRHRPGRPLCLLTGDVGLLDPWTIGFADWLRLHPHGPTAIHRIDVDEEKGGSNAMITAQGAIENSYGNRAGYTLEDWFRLSHDRVHLSPFPANATDRGKLRPCRI
jgi:hypothetical protein